MAMTGDVQVVDVLDQRDGLLATDVERGDGAREEHRVADGQDGQLVAELDGLVVLAAAAASGGPSFRTCDDLGGRWRTRRPYLAS